MNNRKTNKEKRIQTKQHEQENNTNNKTGKATKKAQSTTQINI